MREFEKSMGRSKRKTTSPMMKEGSKTRRTTEEEIQVEETDSASQAEPVGDLIADLKSFIKNENAVTSKKLSEEIRRHNEERMTALETSLSFALETGETLAKRLSEVEKRAEKAEQGLYDSSKRMAAIEEQLDQLQQRDLQNWLIFSGPAVSHRADAGSGETPARLLYSKVLQYMDYAMDMEQVDEIRREDRQIRVRFNAVGVRSDRYFLVRNKTRLRGSGLYIRECLTPFRQGIFQELMQLKRRRQIHTVFTREGISFVVVDQKDRPRPIRTLAALERLIQVLSESYSQDRAPEHQLQRPRARNTEAVAPMDTSAMSRESSGQSQRRGQSDVTPMSRGSGQSQRRDAPGSDGRPQRTQSERPATETPERQLLNVDADGNAETDQGREATPEDGGGGCPEPRSAAAGQRWVASERQSAAAEPLHGQRTEGRRPTEVATFASGIRRRYGGDIRKYVSVSSAGKHSKCD